MTITIATMTKTITAAMKGISLLELELRDTCRARHGSRSGTTMIRSNDKAEFRR